MWWLWFPGVFIGLVAYFLIGAQACKYTVPKALQRGYDKATKRYRAEEDRRKYALLWYGFWRPLTITLWPYAIPATMLYGSGLTPSLNELAPWAAEERKKQLEREVQRLEKEKTEWEGKNG